jgi:hypothetical protein
MDVISIASLSDIESHLDHQGDAGLKATVAAYRDRYGDAIGV